MDALVTQLRATVARSLVLALRAREKGRDDLSEELIAQCVQCEERASALEAMSAKRHRRRYQEIGPSENLRCDQERRRQSPAPNEGTQP